MGGQRRARWVVEGAGTDSGGEVRSAQLQVVMRRYIWHMCWSMGNECWGWEYERRDEEGTGKGTRTRGGCPEGLSRTRKRCSAGIPRPSTIAAVWGCLPFLLSCHTNPFNRNTACARAHPKGAPLRLPPTVAPNSGSAATYFGLGFSQQDGRLVMLC
eukprot:329886-Chlamydomonas_euryale.AAC.1